MAYKLQAGTYDFTDLIEEMPDFGHEWRIAEETAPRRHGSIVTEEPVVDRRTITARGTYMASTYALARAEMATMAVALATQPLTLTVDSDGRYITAYTASFRPEWVEGSATTSFRFDPEFKCSDPFFYASAADSSSQVVTYSPTSWAVSNGGDVLVFPTITITADQGGSISNFTLTNSTTGKSFTFTPTVSNTKSLVVNCANGTVQNDGADARNGLSGTLFIWLPTGSNTLQLSGANATVTVAFRKRYYTP